MNKFYKLPLVLQWVIALILLIIGFYPVLLVLENMRSLVLYGIMLLLYTPVLQFTSHPFFTLVGVYTYYSPMLLGYMANKVQIDLHSGGSFDYLLVMSKNRRGAMVRRSLMVFHIAGLLRIIEQIEQGKIPASVKIIGTSYFFNERTAKKIGFELREPSFFYRLNLFVNFLDLFWMYSFSQGKLSIPKVWQAKKVYLIGSKLVENKEFLTHMHQKLAIVH